RSRPVLPLRPPPRPRSKLVQPVAHIAKPLRRIRLDDTLRLRAAAHESCQQLEDQPFESQCGGRVSGAHLTPDAPRDGGRGAAAHVYEVVQRTRDPSRAHLEVLTDLYHDTARFTGAEPVPVRFARRGDLYRGWSAVQSVAAP